MLRKIPDSASVQTFLTVLLEISKHPLHDSESTNVRGKIFNWRDLVRVDSGSPPAAVSESEIIEALDVPVTD